MANVPTRQTSEDQLNQFNIWMRSQPWYQQFFAQRGLNPNRVKLSDKQQSELEALMGANSVAVPSGMHIDPAGNLNQKNTLGRNIGIGAAIGGAALTGLGAAGIGPLSGALSGTSAAAGAGSMAVPELSVGAIPSVLGPGIGASTAPIGFGSAASSPGVFSRIAGQLRNPQVLAGAGRMIAGAGQAAAQNRGAQIEAQLAHDELRLQAEREARGAQRNAYANSMLGQLATGYRPATRPTGIMSRYGGGEPQGFITPEARAAGQKLYDDAMKRIELQPSSITPFSGLPTRPGRFLSGSRSMRDQHCRSSIPVSTNDKHIMPSRFAFTNVGSAAVDELTKILAEREARKQQEFLNSLRSREMSLQEEQERRQADYQRKQFEDMALTRESQRVDREHEDAMPFDIVSPEMAARHERHGRGGALRRSGAGIDVEARLTSPTTVDVDLSGPMTPEQMAQMDQALTGTIADLESKQTRPSVAPGVIVHRGGTKYLADRKAAEERAEQARIAAQSREEIARENRDAAAERAEADRQLKLLIAQMSASNNAANRALADQLKQIQIDTAKEKLDTARTEKEKAAESARSSTQTAYDLANRLLDSNDVGSGIGAATGAYEMRGFTQAAQDFNAVRDQLVAALALPNLGLLKGPMSDKDVLFVKQLATRIANPRMSETETRKAILEAQTFLENKGAVRSQGGAAMTRTIRNPQTGETRQQTSTDGGKTWK